MKKGDKDRQIYKCLKCPHMYWKNGWIAPWCKKVAGALVFERMCPLIEKVITTGGLTCAKNAKGYLS